MPADHRQRDASSWSPRTARLLRRLVRGAERPAASVFDGRVLEVDEVLAVLTAINAYDDAVAASSGES